jgi:hypothetical protein
MVVPPDQVRFVLFVAYAFVCALGFVTGRRIRCRIRDHHPRVYSQFHFPRSPTTFNESSEHEQQATKADHAYLSSMLRGDFRKLKDPHLQILISRQKKIAWASAVLAILVVTHLCIS